MAIDSRNESGSATKKTYPQETLKVDDITADFEPANKDTYLSDAELEKKFDCDYEAFESCPNWKQVIMKKETWNISKILCDPLKPLKIQESSSRSLKVHGILGDPWRSMETYGDP